MVKDLHKDLVDAGIEHWPVRATSSRRTHWYDCRDIALTDVRKHVIVQVAADLDRAHFLDLAAEAEPLFGPMLEQLHRAISRNLARRTAFCVRVGDEGPGAPLLGGILYSPQPGGGEIGWLVVASRARRRGIARELVKHVVGLVRGPGEIIVTSFGPDTIAGQPARSLFIRAGFRPAGPAPRVPRQLARGISTDDQMRWCAGQFRTLTEGQ